MDQRPSKSRRTHVRRISIQQARTNKLEDIFCLLQYRNFQVEWQEHTPSPTSMQKEKRWQIRSARGRFEVHLGPKKNLTANPIDSIIVQGLKGWSPLILDWIEVNILAIY